MDSPVVNRTPTGQFLPGSVANPSGRPKGARNRITELRQAMEIAVREGMDPEDIKVLMQEMVKLAKGGSVKAAKLVLDKALPNAQDPREDSQSDLPQYVFVIQNATINPGVTQQKPADVVTPVTIDAEFTEAIGQTPSVNLEPLPSSEQTLNISQLELFPV